MTSYVPSIDTAGEVLGGSEKLEVSEATEATEPAVAESPEMAEVAGTEAGSPGAMI